MELMLSIPGEDSDPDWMEVPAPRRRAWEMLRSVLTGTYMLTFGCFGLVLLITVFSFSADHKLNGEISTEIDEAEDWAKRANEVLNLQETFGCPMVCEMSVPCLPGIEKAEETTTTGARRLDEGPESPEAPLRRLTFNCPDGRGIPDSWVNDNFCDCPEDCADEVDWTCETCGIANDENQEAVDVGVGVGVGVGGALALGIGLGTGLGTGLGSGVGSGAGSSSATGAVAALAVLAATGSMRLRVENPSTVQNPRFADALKETIARLSGGIAAAAVELIINCANARRLTERQLQGQSVGICFQVQVEDSGAEELCQTLSGYDSGAVQSVLRSELLDAGIDLQEVTVTGYQASPNPRSYNPLNESGDLDDNSIFVPPEGVSLG